VDRERTFITNVVKHFKWRRSGKRRLHDRPNSLEVAACRPWFEAELAVVRPKAVVCLGATAARALLGPSVRVSQSAGRPIPSPLAPLVIATLHPSAILRADDADRDAMYERLVGDLRMVA
jgi:uracil-DNA glycosylase